MSDGMNNEVRPPIPAGIKRQVLVEAGHRCAIPTCRYIETDIHHIIPWSICKKHSYENLIALCSNCHRRADRDEIDRKSLRIYKGNLRFAHDKYSQLEMDFLFHLRQAGPGEHIMWPPFNFLLIKRIVESEFIVMQKQNMSIQLGGMETAPLLVFLTPKGKMFIDDLASKEF